MLNLTQLNIIEELFQWQDQLIQTVAGSQFFIVHKDSNFLDEQYTVFGRIVTDESFETLDKIANVPTGD